MSAIVEFEQISKAFPGVQALSEVSFSILEGEVHGLVGENGAGKSTLMYILGGQYQPDQGRIICNGNPVVIANQSAAIKLGIGFVYQELILCPNLTVTENIFLGREREIGKGKVHWRKMREASVVVLDSLGANIDPDVKVKKLTVANQQLVEIAKAISLNAKVLIMDEPTSSLTLKESESLFSTIQGLKATGVTVIYISHRLDEVFSITDNISVLRDGRFLGTFRTSEVKTSEIVALIAGRELISELTKDKRKTSTSNNVALQITGLSRENCFSNVTFSLYKNEILGIYGLQGSGRTELLETIFGLAKKSTGKIVIFGKEMETITPLKAIEQGIAMVPEDRRGSGIFAKLDVMENINMSNPRDSVGFLGTLQFRMMKKIALNYKKKIGIKAHLKQQLLRNLSGGNQQKVVIAKWLATHPRILLVDELTRGIDVGAKAEIFKVLQDLRNEGMSIVLVSSELPEIISESDRVLVMRNGKITAVLSGEEISKERIILHALQG